MKFKISVSKQTFESKPTKAEIATITYTKRELNVYELTNLITIGHSFTGLFTDNNEFNVKNKNEQQFKSSSVIFIDIDGMGGMSSDDFIASLTGDAIPNIYYNTYKSKPDAERLRLVYVMSEPIESKAEYRANVEHIVSSLNAPSLKIDHCSYSPFYHYFGTNIDKCNIVQCINGKTHKTVKLKDVSDESAIQNNNKEEKNNIDSDCTLEKNNDFMRDFWKMDNRYFIIKYNDTYEIVNNTPLPCNEDSMFIVLPKDYIEIRRKTYTVKDDVRQTRYTTTYRWKDGEGRRRKLYMTAILRRIMLSDISFEQLLYNTVWELENFYLNTKADYITKKDIYGIVTRALSDNVDNYRKAIKTDKRKFIVNPYYLNKENLTKRQMANMSRKLIHYEQIGELYDCDMTDKENLEVMRQYGVKCSLRTLKNFKKEAGLTKDYSKSNKETKHYILDMEVNCFTFDEPVHYGTIAPNTSFYNVV